LVGAEYVAAVEHHDQVRAADPGVTGRRVEARPVGEYDIEHRLEAPARSARSSRSWQSAS